MIRRAAYVFLLGRPIWQSKEFPIQAELNKLLRCDYALTVGSDVGLVPLGLAVGVRRCQRSSR